MIIGYIISSRTSLKSIGLTPFPKLCASLEWSVQLVLNVYCASFGAHFSQQLFLTNSLWVCLERSLSFRPHFNYSNASQINYYGNNISILELKEKRL